MTELDCCDRENDIRLRIQGKDALFKLYNEFYHRYVECLKRCPIDGACIEIGSGGGFLKDIIPNVVTTDIITYKAIDLAMDASEMPFKDDSIKSFFLLNTLHHLPNAKSFFCEMVRCLKHRGRVLIIDQYRGWFSNIIYKYLHHEPYVPDASVWNFQTSGPLSGANGALCWIIFFRDRILFEKRYPSLKIVNISPNTPLRYWLSGGLKQWNLLPGSFFRTSTELDRLLSNIFPDTCSFVDVEIQKVSR